MNPAYRPLERYWNNRHHDSQRHIGVGTALLDAVERWATAKGAKEIIVNSGNHREGAHLFYEARGFRATGLRFKKSLT